MSTVQIPANHNVVGTCGECGGPIISPMTWWSGTTHCPPPEWCLSCHRAPKPDKPTYGPVREMQEQEPPPNWPVWPQ